MRHPVVRVGPRGGLIVREDGPRKEYQRKGSDAIPRDKGTPRRKATPEQHRAEVFEKTQASGREYAILHSDDGTVYHESLGTQDECKIPVLAAEECRPHGLHLVHGHPAGMPPSPGDWFTMVVHRLDTLEAVACVDEEGKPYDRVRKVYRLDARGRDTTLEYEDAQGDPATVLEELDELLALARYDAATSGLNVTKRAMMVSQLDIFSRRASNHYGVAYEHKEGDE